MVFPILKVFVQYFFFKRKKKRKSLQIYMNVIKMKPFLTQLIWHLVIILCMSIKH